jgi:membrane-bound lytic murein transglycosylase D
MGRYLLWRKTLTGFAVLFFSVTVVSRAVPDIKRYESRRVFREEDEFPGARQFHGGPAIFSPEFALNGQAQYYLDRISSSEHEQGWILAAMERSTLYAQLIREKIEEYGLPPEIFYLPVVESLYKINAYSRSGALGLWQFMRGSAHPWMEIDEWIDERKDFWKSTEAAMKKLAYNYRATDDWLLALAAYNCGLGKIQRIMKQSGLKDFWEISRRGLIPQETREYIPKLIATAHFAQTLGRRGLERDWKAPVRWQLVKIEKPLDIRLLAEAAGIPAENISAGNVELLYGITPPASRAYYLKVRAEDSGSVQEAIRNHDGKLMKFAVHTIEAGHTLSEIAHHYSIPLSMLLRYNPGIRAEALRIGSRLVVPMYKDAAPFVKKAALPAGADVSRFINEYTVKTGDSLWTIARRFGTTSSVLAAANGIAENGILRPGMSLKVPQGNTE